MAPKGLYSVQKSRSFGGSNNFQDTPPKETCLSPEPGRKTPNFDSLRKKFSRKKTTSFDDDDGDFADGTTLTLKKKGKGQSKVGNIFNKLFRKDSKDHEPIYEHDNLTPKIKRLIQKQNEEPRVISVNPRPFRSNSFDSICSVGSAASSFAFVPVTAYKVGKYVEPKKKIAIGINCGPETYRKRQEPRDLIPEADRELTLKTKYNLMSSDSPPTLTRRQLPTGPLLQSSELHRNDDTNSSSSGESDTDTVEELGSISQRCSPARQSSGPGPALGALASMTQASCADQQRGPANKNTADNEKNTASPVPALQSIKPRELTGQLLYPMTIRPSEENKRNGYGSHSSGSDNGTLKPSRQPHSFAQPPLCVNNSGRDSENLPKSVTAETVQSVSVFHSPQPSSYQFCPRQDSPLSSPRHSISSDDNKPGLHIPGKRRAPAPPARTRTPDTGGGAQLTGAEDCQNPFVKRKGRAPQPPGDKAETEDRGESCAENGGQCQPEAGPRLAGGQVNTGSCVGAASAASAQTCDSGSQGMMSGSAPTSPLIGKKYPPGCQPPDEWVIRDGLLKCIRESQQDLTEDKEKESKDAKVPLSPKPWYKRNLIKENSNKKQKDKKAKSPDNLPDNHASRDAFKVTEDEKSDISKAAKIRQEAPKSPKMFLRSKLMPGSPKAERPSSRPISGLTGISDLDRQAAEIIRRKNEDEAAKKKAGDEKFYASKLESEGMEAQKAIDDLMDKMSKKMTRLEGISKINNEWLSQLQNEKKTHCDLTASPKKESDIEDDFQSMGNVVSDLNSFLVSTRKAMSSPSAQNRHQKSQNTAEQQSCKNLKTHDNSIKVEEATNTSTEQQMPQQQQPPLKIFKELEKSQDVQVKRMNNNNTQRNNFLSGNPESVSFSSPSSGNKSAREQKQTINTDTLSDADQNVNYFPAEQKTHYPPPPPECPRSDADWSCHRCTLINNSNSVCCEVCGARREVEQFSHQDLDQESEDAPPKPGNVLNKLVLFSSIDARAKETPSLQRRKSADVNKLLRTSSSAAMFPVVENPLQKTLERITEKQAELAKTKDCFNNNNFSSSKDANTDKCKLGPSLICQATKSSNQTGNLVQQRPALEEENLNSLKHDEQMTNILPDEKTCTLPFGNVSSKISNDNYILNENSLSNQNNLIMRSASVIIPPQSNKEIENSSLKGSFDFTRTPGSFLSSSKISQPTPKPWSKFSHNNDTALTSIKAAPKLEFLSAEVSRKHSAPVNEDLRITQTSRGHPGQDSQRTCQV